jgi:hypothetical protein
MLASRKAAWLIAAAALGFWSSESRAQSCVAPAFDPPVVTETGPSEPRNMFLEDFTRDGFLDLAVLKVSSAEVAILQGGPGGFVLGPVLPYSSAADVAAADFNRDGFPDLAVAGVNDDRVYVTLSDGSGGFLPTFGVDVGSMPISLATGDFDDDGSLDVAVTTNGDGKLFVLRGNGTGGFPAPLIQLSSIPPARQMAAAEVNGDGILDLLTTFEANDELIVVLGNGDGTFQPPAGFLGSGTQPSGLAIGDFNRDGAVDAVVVFEASGLLELFRGDGSGGFGSTGTFAVGGGTYNRVAAGDLNRDGILDVVVPDKASKDLSVFLGDGAGFTGPAVLVADAEGFDASIADFDRDGRSDLAVSHLTTDQVGLFSNGFGLPCPNPSFGELGRLLGVGATPSAIAPGDFDRDGNLDLVVANQAANTITRYLGRGIGEFASPAAFGTGTTPVSIATGDFDSDGDLDVVTANQGSNDLRVHTNDAGSFATSTPVALPGTPVHVVAADVSLDGKTDLIVTRTANDVYVLKNNGSGGFPTADAYSVGASPRAIAFGDFNNDSFPDLAVSDTTSSQIVFLRNDGTGAFLSAPPYVLAGAATAIQAAFVNGGGNLDLVVTRGTGASARIETHLGNGAFAFGLGTSQLVGGGAGGPHGLEVADFNQDGRVDALVAAQEVNRVRIFFGNGTGAFSGVRSEMTPVAPSGVAAGDFNRDGLVDILVGQGSTNQVLALMAEKQGTGQTFYSPEFLAASTDARGLTPGDFNRDGKPDLVVANAGNDSVSFFRGNGNGTFASGLSFSTGAGTRPRWVSAGDFDNDGKLDLVASAESTGELIFLQGDGAGGFGFPLPSPVGAAPYINRAADFDFDGDLDVAVLSGSFVEVYRGDGFGSFSFITQLSLGGTGSGLMVGDFNRDGPIDIAAAQTTGDVVLVFYGIDPGSWSVPTQLNPGRAPADFDAADFDGNGFVDFVIPLEGDNRLRLALANGLGQFILQTPVSTGSTPRSARALDSNGDGGMDVVVASRGDHAFHFHLGDGTGGLGSATGRPPGIRMPTWLAVSDFDLDSMTDVAAVPDVASGNNPGILVAINTNCDMRQLRFVSDVSSCDLPGFPFSTQPRIELLDDGENPLQCELGPLTASIVPGTGGGGALFGNTVLAQTPPTAVVSYFNLGVTAPGGGYQLQFQHSAGVTTRSRTFSQGLSPTITGPAALCDGAPALYDGGAGYDMYSWFLDSTPKSMARTVDLTSSLTPGTHRIDLDVVRDTCLATTFLDVLVTANLSSVVASPLGPISVCANCSGPAVTATPAGGGAVTYQWGFRATSGGPITDLAGETGASYGLEGQDFPGPGAYFLVVTVSPACGADLVSNEVEIDVGSAVAPDPLVAFTALSTKGQNRLEWSYLAGCVSVRILRRDDGIFPNDPNDTVGNDWVNGADFPCAAAGKSDFDDAGLADNTKYFYSAFVNDGFNFSLKRTVTGRPFNNTVGKVKWAFSTGFTAMAQAGVRILGGLSSVYVVSNGGHVFALNGGANGGQWLANAKPYLMGGPSQVRPPVVHFSVGTGALTAPNGAAFVTSQDGNVYALDADELDTVWTAPVGEQVLGAATGMFSGFFAGAPNKIFVGTKNTIATNAFRAFDVETGVLSWSFENSVAQGGTGVPPGMILGGASLHYQTTRAFFGSRYGGGTQSIWAIDVSGATPMLLWSQDIGEIDTSPVLLPGTPRRLVVGTNAAKVHLLDADAGGISMWTAPYSTGDGNVKGFVFPHSHGGFQYFMFSTLSRVTSIRHNGTGTNPTVNWQVTTIPSPSTPLFLPGTLDALVGAGNGRIYRINRVDTTTPTVTFLQLGDGLSAIGPASFDVANDLAYAGSDEGVVYAIEYPFP